MRRCRRSAVCGELADLASRDPSQRALSEQIIVLNAKGQIEVCRHTTHGDCATGTGGPCPLSQSEEGRGLLAAVLRGQRREGTFEYATPDRRQIHLASVVARDGGGATITHVDITAQRRLEDRLRVAAVAFEDTNEMHAVVDATGTVLLANHSAEQALGRAPGGLEGVHLSELCDAGFVRQSGEQIRAQMQREGSWAGEASLTSAGGEAFSVWGTVHRVAESTTRYLIAASALEGAQRGKDNLAVMALVDPLTRLRNRRAFLEHLRFALLRGERHGSQVGMLYLDLDDFKAINDSLGHDVGDEVLRQVGERLQDAVRATDLCARLGGDEFAIVVEDVRGPPALAAVRGKVQKALAVPLLVRHHPLQIEVSLGSALPRLPGTTAEELLSAADKAMYLAKRRRKRMNLARRGAERAERG